MAEGVGAKGAEGATAAAGDGRVPQNHAVTAAPTRSAATTTQGTRRAAPGRGKTDATTSGVFSGMLGCRGETKVSPRTTGGGAGARATGGGSPKLSINGTDF